MSTITVGQGQQFTSIQAAVDANPAGTTFNILAGTYNESISPKNGDVFNGAGVGQTVLNGQNSLADGFWGPTAGVGNPGAQNVTISGMTIENFTDMGIREGSVENNGWVITNNEIAFNGGEGINFGNGDIFKNNIVHDNQLNGLEEVWSQNLTISDNLIYNNNLSHSDPWTATSDTGGTKFNGGGSFTITNNKIYGNYGPALWFDNGVHNVTISGNEIFNTTNGPGIDVEINLPQGSNTATDFVIHDNFIHDNDGAGVLLLNSGNVETYNNTFANNSVAAYVIGDEGNRGTASNSLPYLNENDSFHNNRVATTTLAVMNYDAGSNNWKAQNNTFSGNTYYLPSGAAAFSDNGSHLTAAQWQAEGFDTNSTFNSNGGILPNGALPTSGTVGSAQTDPSAQTPTLSVQAASGDEGSSIPLTITSAQASTNLAASDLAIDVSGLQGASLNHGTLNADGSYTLHPSDLQGLRVTPTAEFTGQLPLTVTATNTEPSSDTTATTATLAIVTVNPVAEKPTLTVQPASGTVGSSIPLMIEAVQTESDLSTTDLTINISGLRGATLNHGALNANGSYTLDVADLQELSLTMAAKFKGTSLPLRVTATDTEASSHTTAHVGETLDITLQHLVSPHHYDWYIRH